MDNEQYLFERNKFSYADIGNFFILIVLLSCSVFFLINHRYIPSLILLLVAAAILYLYKDIPQTVHISMDKIVFGKDVILWHNITNVLFTVGGGRDFRDIQIHIMESKNKYVIHTKLYKNDKELRILFENLCREKGIKYIVRDRGSN